MTWPILNLPTDAANSRSFTTATYPSHYHFKFPPHYEIVLEEAPSGYLNPRTMVKAQTLIAQRQGAKVIANLVTDVQQHDAHVEVTLGNSQILSLLQKPSFLRNQQNCSERLKSKTRFLDLFALDSILTAKIALLASGRSTNCFDLVPHKLAVKPISTTILLAEVGADDAEQLKHLPPLNYKTPTAPILHLSILPPLLYPDGRVYIKVVVNSDVKVVQINRSVANLLLWTIRPFEMASSSCRDD